MSRTYTSNKERVMELVQYSISRCKVFNCLYHPPIKYFFYFFRMKRCKLSCPIIHPSEEESLMSKGFVLFCIVNFIVIIVLCSISITYITKTNVTSLLSVDVETIFIAVVFLAIIILIVGWSSATNNNFCLWLIFHVFMVVLLLLEVVVCLFTSNFQGFSQSLESEWGIIDEAQKNEIQIDLNCCGLHNITDQSVEPCPRNAENGCLNALDNVLYTVRNAASVAMFVCFTLGLFIDFAGCAICFHPDTINFEEHEKEQAMNDGRALDADAFNNPFASEPQIIDL